MKKIAMLRKKLTVRTLSFMMAAGLLLLIVPFVALASGKEEPNPGKKGDFRLLKGIYSTTQIDLAKEDQRIKRESLFVDAIVHIQDYISQLELLVDDKVLTTKSSKILSELVFKELKLIKAVMKSDKKRTKNQN